jgi:hypothetical protein
MIRKRDPGHFGQCTIWKYRVTQLTRVVDQIIGPVLISALLFCAVLANFIIRGKLPQLLERFLKRSPLSFQSSYSTMGCSNSTRAVRILIASDSILWRHVRIQSEERGSHTWAFILLFRLKLCIWKPSHCHLIALVRIWNRYTMVKAAIVTSLSLRSCTFCVRSNGLQQ